MEKQPAVYMLVSNRDRTVYIGVTSDLSKRVWEHRKDLVEGFTKKYAVHRLVYYEMHGDMISAIAREKQLKKWDRAWKLKLIDKRTWNGKISGMRLRSCKTNLDCRVRGNDGKVATLN